MNKLWISPEGVVKVIDVPEGTIYFRGHPLYNHILTEKYKQEIAAAKQSWIEVSDQEQARSVIFWDSVNIRVTDTIHDLPEGWRVEIKESWGPLHENTFAEKVAVLPPPVSQKVESQDNLLRGKLLEFKRWYDALQPSQKVSVWSKDGSEQGLFSLDSGQIVDKFLSIKPKVCKEKINGSCPLHNLHCAYPKCEE
jgi:hypothetical protein